MVIIIIIIIIIIVVVLLLWWWWWWWWKGSVSCALLFYLFCSSHEVQFRFNVFP